MSLSLGHPSLSHPWYGGLVVRRPVSRKNKRNPKISVLRDKRSNAHYSQQCRGNTYLHPPLELVVHSDVKPAAHCLWSLRCWSYLRCGAKNNETGNAVHETTMLLPPPSHGS
jgi:hypothetical protein